MNPSTATAIRTYSNEMSAQLALMELESSGIDAEINADDCGGCRPELQISSGVTLLVNSSDLQTAEEIMTRFEQREEEMDPPMAPKEASADTPPSRILWLIIGLLIASLGWGTHLYRQTHPNGVIKYDVNNDGQWDTWWTYTKGLQVENAQDNDFDGSPDNWQHYTSNIVTFVETDANFDGRIDKRYYYQKGVIASSEHDEDHNGIFDVFVTYRLGVTHRVKVRPNGSKVVTRDERYQAGILCTEWVDSDADGNFDIKRSYDVMGMEIEETLLD